MSIARQGVLERARNIRSRVEDWAESTRKTFTIEDVTTRFRARATQREIEQAVGYLRRVGILVMVSCGTSYGPKSTYRYHDGDGASP